MNVKHLKFFQAVMKTGSVSGAARLLSVTQPAVTKTIQQLEYDLGIPLFERVSGRLRPTEESLLLLPKVNQVFASVEEVDLLSKKIAKLEQGKVTFAVAPTIGTSIASGAIKQFRSECPRISLRIKALATRDVVEQVGNNLVDFGICDTATITGGLQVEEICRAYVGCVMPKSHELTRLQSVHMADLASDPVITFFEDTVIGSQLRRLANDANEDIDFAISTNQSMMACRLVEEGMGIALIDPFTISANAYPNLAIRPIEPRIEIRPRFVYPPSRPLSIAARELIAKVKEHFAEQVRMVIGMDVI